METRFSTVTRYDLELFQDLITRGGWKLNIFRRFYISICLLAIILATAVRTMFLANSTGASVIPAVKPFFAVAVAALAAAFVLEMKNVFHRDEKTLQKNAQTRLQQSGKAGGKEEIHWYEDSCLIETDEVTSSYRYEGLRKAEEGEKHIFITFGGNVVIPVDKSGFLQGRADKFVKFINEKIAANEKN